MPMLSKKSRRRGSTQLTIEQKAALLKDFKQWSGGFSPSEMAYEDVKTYIKAALSTELDRTAALNYLLEC